MERQRHVIIRRLEIEPWRRQLRSTHLDSVELFDANHLNIIACALFLVLNLHRVEEHTHFVAFGSRHVEFAMEVVGIHVGVIW